MEAKELRVGNFVSDKNASESFYAKVKKIDYSRCYYGQFHSAYSNLKPIPLTEEWLLRFGFIKTNGRHGDYFYHKEQKLFRVWAGLESLWGIGRKDPNSVNQSYNTHWIVLDLKFVHQLQNLFIELTREELEVGEE